MKLGGYSNLVRPHLRKSIRCSHPGDMLAARGLFLKGPSQDRNIMGPLT